MARLLLLGCLMLFALSGAAGQDAPTANGFRSVRCEGAYPQHLQGVCADERDALFWSFTTRLVKTDPRGKLLKEISVESHHGDLCYAEGKLYVAVNLGKFNEPEGKADSWIYVYDASDLSLKARHAVPQAVHGAGGIAFHDGRFMVVGGLPPQVPENYVYELDRDLRFVRRHTLASGYTLMGIQTAAFADGHWWFGCYGDPKTLLKADAGLSKVQRSEFDGSLGIVPLGAGRFLIGRDTNEPGKGHVGRLLLAEADPLQGLRLREPERR